MNNLYNNRTIHQNTLLLIITQVVVVVDCKLEILLTNDFKPDWLSIKPTSLADNHVVFDSNRGSDRQLKFHETDAEHTHSPARITFETNGFDVDTTDQNYNQSSATYVGSMES